MSTTHTRRVAVPSLIKTGGVLLVALLLISSTSWAAQTVTDALGRQVTFQNPPQRIVVTGRGFFMISDALYLFPEAAERVAALGIFRQGTTNFLTVVDPDAASKTVLHHNAGPEQIAAFQPDAVILKSYLAQKIGQAIEVLGIPVVYLDLETPEQYTRDIRILGEIFGQPERAEDVVHYYQQRVEQIHAATQDIAAAEKPRVLMLHYSDKDGVTAFQVPPLTWIQTRLVELAGGEPVWRGSMPGKGWKTVSLEQIMAWDPDVICILSYFNDPSEITRMIAADATWQPLRAVQEGKVYAFPGDLNIWDQPNPRWILGLTWLAKTLHPARFATTDIIAAARDFYQQLYRLDTDVFATHIQPTFKGDLR